jgi:hypothetical protein
MRDAKAAFSEGEPPTLVDSVLNDARRDSVGARGPSIPGVVIRWWAVLASLGAGLINLATVSDYVSESSLYGAFFLVLAVVQIGWAVQAMERGPLPFPQLFAAVNVAVIGLWFVSRTTGRPVGPEPWVAGTMRNADLLCIALEAVVVVLLVLTVRRPQAQESAALTKAQRRMVAVGAVAAAAVTVAALAANPPNFRHAPHTHGDHAAEAPALSPTASSLSA